MRHSLIVIFDTPDNITTWDIRPCGIDVSHFLNLCLQDLEGAKIDGFTCSRAGSVITQEIEDCETVDEWSVERQAEIIAAD